MPRLLAGSFVLLWSGLTLLLSRMGWFNRRTLSARLGPYVPGGLQLAASRGRSFAAASLSDLVATLARDAGARFAALLGVNEPLAVRLARVHSPHDVTSFRVRQLRAGSLSFAVGVVLAAAVGAPLSVALLFTIGGGLLGFLIVEQQLAMASDRWKRRIFLELPVLSEQLAMLLGAGFSLGSALNRLAARGSGACGQDLALVTGRIRQGLSEVDALREWASTADVDALHRLVGLLALNRDAGDLGRLVSEEARSIRREVQRELIEHIERRSQQVWIPVTVATLVPGAVLLAIPFVEALRLFSTS